jgi:non-ribosomal peptide synthetase component F
MDFWEIALAAEATEAKHQDWRLRIIAERNDLRSVLAARTQERDELRAELAAMTERAEEAERIVALHRSRALDELAAVDADIAAGQAPLGAEFEAAWAENLEELYESDAGTISKEGT